jgi:hypothetical protein
MAGAEDSVVFEWLRRIGLTDAIPSFMAKGIVTPKVRSAMQRPWTACFHAPKHAQLPH